ncbi:serine hydrolase domain-containing protein [Lacticaseibacillus parakribbianus]|uniref:serine hydrolase domain-containing protein n=1 Tax=Lacticaseibacillus parakribbianus TaxID=2970927 RepID=UPI0021CB0D2A|nr:serine hydrolase domain-containing protein [Lacticaseibacillus parakribbianus]
MHRRVVQISWWHRGLMLAAILIGVFAWGFWLGRVSTPQQAEVRTLQQDASKKKATVKKAAPALAVSTNEAAQTDLDATLSKLDFSGTAVIIKNGAIVASRASGLADAAANRPNTLDTMFQIDSLQKSLTAGLLVQQINAGKLAFTSRLGQFYQRFAQSPITVADMLHMASGLAIKGVLTPTYVDDTQLVAANLGALADRPNLRGTFVYTPVNYLLLAGLGEQLSGQSYEAQFKQRYIDGLKLTHTQMAYALDHRLPIATGYKDAAYKTPQAPTTDRMHAELGTGQVYMSVTDLYRTERALVTGQLTGASRNQLYQPGYRYSGGFYIHSDYYRTNGVGYGFYDTFRITPDGQNAVVLFSNVQDKSMPALGDAVTRLMQRYCLPQAGTAKQASGGATQQAAGGTRTGTATGGTKVGGTKVGGVTTGGTKTGNTGTGGTATGQTGTGTAAAVNQ